MRVAACLVLACLAHTALAGKPSKSTSAFDREIQRKRQECAARPEVVEPCFQEDVDVENCIIKCVSAKCYSSLFPEPIEDGEVISYQNHRLSRCMREELKAEKAAEARREMEKKRERKGDAL